MSLITHSPGAILDQVESTLGDHLGPYLAQFPVNGSALPDIVTFSTGPVPSLDHQTPHLAMFVSTSTPDPNGWISDQLGVVEEVDLYLVLSEQDVQANGPDEAYAATLDYVTAIAQCLGDYLREDAKTIGVVRCSPVSFYPLPVPLDDAEAWTMFGGVIRVRIDRVTVQKTPLT